MKDRSIDSCILYLFIFILLLLLLLLLLLYVYYIYIEYKYITLEYTIACHNCQAFFYIFGSFFICEFEVDYEELDTNSYDRDNEGSL